MSFVHRLHAAHKLNLEPLARESEALKPSFVRHTDVFCVGFSEYTEPSRLASEGLPNAWLIRELTLANGAVNS